VWTSVPTCKCGKQVEDWRGARGHVQFTEGGGHGEKGDVPDDWKDLFSEDEPEDDESDDEPASDDGDDEDDPSPTKSEESDSDQSEPSESNGDSRTFSDRLSTALTDDVRALWGGDR